MDAKELEAMTTADLIALFEAAQAIQKRNPPSALEWKVASVAINAIAPIVAKRADRVA